MHAAAVLPLLVLLLPPLAAALDEDCTPASCGNLSIRYPFWLRGRQPPYCGYPSFGIDCDPAGAPPLLNGSYLGVLGIQYGNSTVVAFHTNLADDPTGCRATKFNLSANLALSLVAISRANWGLFLLQLLADASGGVVTDELHGPGPVVRVPEPELRDRGPRAGGGVDGLPVRGRNGDARVRAEGAGRLREARQARVPAGVDAARGLCGVRRERGTVPARRRRECVQVPLPRRQHAAGDVPAR